MAHQMTITHYLSLEPVDGCEGFTIRSGKKVYWYVSPMPRSGLYRVLPVEADGSLGWPRYVPGSTRITLVMTSHTKHLSTRPVDK